MHYNQILLTRFMSAFIQRWREPLRALALDTNSGGKLDGYFNGELEEN